MSFERFHHKFTWTPKTNWLAPKGDLSTPVHFDTVTKEVAWVMRHVKDTDGSCIQAGGNIGLWPYRYSQFFEFVYTFEPCEENYYCMVANLEGITNVKTYPFALGDKWANVSVTHIPRKPISYGARYVVEDPQGEVNQIALDDMATAKSGIPYDTIKLIHLDIEGRELFALEGARQLIERDRPVIVLEARKLDQMDIGHNAAVEWLSGVMGYSIEAASGDNRIMVPNV